MRPDPIARIRTLTFMLLALLPVTLQAEPGVDNSEWFIAVKTSIGNLIMDDNSHGGSIGTGAPLGGFIDGQIEDSTTDDYTAGAGIALGKRFGHWTLEGEYVYRYRTDWDIAAPTPSIATVVNVFSNVETHTLLLNLIRRGVINRRWSWEVGAGVGLVSSNLETEYLERATPTTGEFGTRDDASETDFSYNVLLGVTRELGRAWTLNLRYRYIDLGELSAGSFPQRAVRVKADVTGHELQLSLEYEL